MKKTVKTFLCCILLFILCLPLGGCVKSTIVNEKKEMEWETPVKQGEFYTLEQAYDAKLVSKEDLLSIAYYYQGRKWNEEIIAENFSPKVKEPDVLDEKTIDAIKETVVAILCEEVETMDFKKGYVNYLAYYGTYNDAVAIRIAYSATDRIILNDVFKEDIISDIKFVYTSYTDYFQIKQLIFDNRIIIWINK